MGDSCTDDAECPAGGACRRDITEGTCVIACGTSCSVCPQGSSCMEYEGEMLCFKACERGSDCMFGQGCWYEGSVTGCKPVCETHEDCPVGTVCTLGSCLRRAGRDAGCSLCDDRDAAQPPGTDAAQPLPPPPSGCGCGVQGGAGTATGILAAALLGAALRRRTRCRT
ncbi:MAG: hypothetical protein HY901_34555 [Deltaproteobacteria bacterium]|nr:hypothetical protein [Deltaproteobacteria bacterium]